MNASLLRSVDNVLFVPLRSLSRVARRSLNNNKRAGWKRKVIINLMQPLLGWCELYTVQRVTTSASMLYLAMKTFDCFQRQLLELSITAAALNVKQGPSDAPNGGRWAISAQKYPGVLLLLIFSIGISKSLRSGVESHEPKQLKHSN